MTVMSYAAAHKWEPLAKSRGVSKVARSARGFMRALERAGSVSKLSEYWQRRRKGFIARHMAQAKNNGEKLWKSKNNPSNRALALIMWAYMPPGRSSAPTKTKKNPTTKKVKPPQGKTKQVVDYIVEAFKKDPKWTFHASLFTLSGFRANTGPAIRYLKEMGVIEPAYYNTDNQPVWGMAKGLKKNPSKKATKRRSNPGAEGVLLGNLTEIEVRLPSGRIRKLKPKDLRIGALGARGTTLCILKKSHARGNGTISSSTAAKHKKFHNANHTKATQYEWPEPVGRLVNIGRIVSVTYTIPKGMKSPQKDKYRWKHEFGDHGERGHGPADQSGNYPQKYMPMLQKDSKGNLYIKRMTGNKFYVTQWIYW